MNYEEEKMKKSACDAAGYAAREKTVEEALYEREALLERALYNLRALRNGMSQDYLRRPASVIAEL